MPANRRRVIKAGMGGNGTLLALPKVVRPDYYYRDLWIGEPKENQSRLTQTAGPYAIVRGFSPAAQEVTLHNVKGTYLKFDMIFGAAASSGTRPFYTTSPGDGMPGEKMEQINGRVRTGL